MRTLLYIDSSFTLSEIRARGLDHVLRVRFLDGYFGRVISAHPADMRCANAGVEAQPGSTVVEELDVNHYFVRGRFGRYKVLKRLSALNAFLALFDFCRALLRIAKHEEIDAVRAGDPLLCGIIGLGVARATGMKLMIRIPANNDLIRSSTGEPTQPRFTRNTAIEKWLERLVISHADVIITPSTNYANFAVSKGADCRKIHTVRYGAMIDPRHRVPPERRPAPDIPGLVDRLAERSWLLHVGRLHRVKHVEDCFYVIELLAAKGCSAGLLLAGDGPLRMRLERRVAKAGLADRVLFLGNISQDQLFALLPHASVVLSPLTGRALAEVAFAGRPIVAYDLDWQSDLIRDGETGVLVAPRDSVAMAEGARRLLENPTYARTMGSAVRTLALDMLSPEAAKAAERAAYEALMEL